jgi:hypothetical protein
MNRMIDTSPARHWFMHTPHAAIGMGSAIKVLPPPSQTPLPETRTLRVGMVIGRDATWDVAAAHLAEHFDETPGLIVEHAWESAAAGDDVADAYDCLLLLGWPAATDRPRLKQIEWHCRGGGPLVALRTLNAEVPGWPDFAEEVFGGRQPAARWSRLLEVERSDVAWYHPVVDGVEAMLAEGEVYHGPRLSPLATVLLTADDGRGPAPVAWTTRHAGGRIFCSTLGHDDDFRERAFLRLISNAIRWAGTRA